MANKVKYGLKNVHYAKVTETIDPETGAIVTSYGTIKKWLGAVSIELSPEGTNEPFYADDSIYVTTSANSGYSGSFTSALIPEDVLLSIFNQTKDAETGLVTESTDDRTEYIALMFEIDGDKNKRRYIFYRAMLTRASVAGETTEDAKTPQTESIDIRISGRPEDGKVKAYADEGTSAYTDFFTTVQVAS